MSMGSLGILSSLSNAQATARTADVDKAQREQADSARETESSLRTEKANGIGAADEFSATGDRDADGRQFFGGSSSQHSADNKDQSEIVADALQTEGLAKDPLHEAGGQLDLQG